MTTYQRWMLALCLSALPASLSAQALYITELMASNDSTVRDQDGDFSDWLEIYNDEDFAVNVDGYHLTDDRLELDKWRIPDVTIPGKSFLLVFCSDKDRSDPSSELHTNFKLTSLGEYLALVRPDRETIVWEYDLFPPQVADFSYGLSQNGQIFTFVDESLTARAIIPANDNLGTDWLDPDFDDAGWDSGRLGVGYDRNDTYRLHIRIDVRGDMENVNTSCYVRIPFEVDDPAGISGFQLGVKYDDGFVCYLNGRLVASANAPASLSWNSNASAQHDDGAAVQFEDHSFIAANVLRAGTNVLAFHGLNVGLGSSDFLISAELRATTSGELDSSHVLYFPTATPGSGNVQGYAGVAETPTLSVEGAAFTGSIDVDLTVNLPETVVRYTTDSSEPTENSPVANGPITVTSSSLLQVRGFAPDKAPSPIASAGFLRVDTTVRNATSDIPIFVIENFGGGAPPSGSFQQAFGVLFEPMNGRTRLTNPPTLQSPMGIKIRGSSTAGQPKKQYAMEIWDNKGEDRAVSLLGMPKEADWILYGGNSYDRAMVRNAFIFQLSNDVGAYAPRTEWCEIYLNQNGGDVNSSDYIGVYAITEKIERDPNRVDVQRLTAAVTTEPDISGGYMFKVDRLDPGDSGFSAGGQTLGWVYPKEDFVTGGQANWLANHINEFIGVLNGGNFRHPTLGYRRYIDIDQWIAHHVLNVLSMNADALRLSTYYHKARNGPIIAGPIWDFDRAMGSTDGRDDNTSSWNGGTNYFAYPWWGRLFDDLDFDQLWIDRWHEWRRGPLSQSAQESLLALYEQLLSEAGERNRQRWGWTLSSEIGIMRNWLRSRSSFIDSQLVSPPNAVASRKIVPGFTVELAGGTTIYYTLDGTDPRAPGGNVAAGAQTYSGPFTVEGNVKVTARRRSGNLRSGDRPRSNWSGPIVRSYWVREPRLVISEMMYHPPAPFGQSQYRDDDFEFVELFNAEDSPLDLEGFKFTNGIDFVFGPGPDLAPGDYVVIVSNLAAFETRYDTAGIRVAGEYAGNLNNSGDLIALEGPLGEPIHQFGYSDVWEPLSDGGGLSLVAVDPLAELATWGDAESWIGSSVVLGTPGGDDPGLADLGGHQRPGDSNQDGVLDLSDPIDLLRKLFRGGLTLPCDGGIEEGGNLFVLDVTGDLSVNLSDAVFLLNYLFKDGPPPIRGQSCTRVNGCPRVFCGI